MTIYRGIRKYINTLLYLNISLTIPYWCSTALHQLFINYKCRSIWSSFSNLMIEACINICLLCFKFKKKNIVMIIVSQYITIYRAVICIISPGSCQYTPITIYVSVKHFKHRTEENKQTKAITSFSSFFFIYFWTRVKSLLILALIPRQS